MSSHWNYVLKPEINRKYIDHSSMLVVVPVPMMRPLLSSSYSKSTAPTFEFYLKYNPSFWIHQVEHSFENKYLGQVQVVFSF